MKRVDAGLTDDGQENRAILAELLGDGPVEVRLPDGRFPLAAGTVIGDGQAIRGRTATDLVCTEVVRAPLLHVLGSGAALSDLTLHLPPATPGPHDGAQCTAITVGEYLYPSLTSWITDVTIERVRVDRGQRCAANSIGIMGAVTGARLSDIDVNGGGTGIAVHWGAIGDSVSTITGPSFHPNNLRIERLAVRNAFEGFYLSSVHEVSVEDVTCDEVEIGFRLLPGDNTDYFHETPGTSGVSSNILVRDCRIGWRGIYGVRVAGWGRSEVDRLVRRLPYRQVSIDGLQLKAGPAVHRRHAGRRAGIVLDDAEGVVFTGIDLGKPRDGVGDVIINRERTSVAALPA